MADLLENLNGKQREAVLETEGYIRVIAGAGSGKTKLLVSRYAYLVQDYGIDSSNILCVTFTNKAAGEMKKRIRALIGDGYDTSLICTYHGFCNRLLRENPEKLFLNKQFQIIDASQQKAILSEIYQKFELKLDYASFESILRKIGHAKRDTGYVTRICNPKPCQILEDIKDQDDRIIEEFLQRQKATYSLDFHDLISFAIYLLETDEDVREKWQNRLNYIMVDEFQDSSAVEMRLVDILSGLFNNLMIVGDPDQNIYEWRGSDVRLLVDFDKVHEPTKTIILNQNYRSTPQILQCANTLIEKNKLRLKKDLFTNNSSGAPVIHYHSKNDFEEMDQVISNIKKLHTTEGFRYSDFAIIYRSSFLSRIAEKKLVEKNIPYEIFGGVRFYQRMEILDILAYLKLIAFDDDTSFRRVVNTPRRRFGRAKMNFLDRLREHRKNEVDAYPASLFDWMNGDYVSSPAAELKETSDAPETLFGTLSRYLDEKEFQNSDVAPFVRFIEEMRKKYRKMRISDIVNEVAKNSGYEAYIRELGDEERLDNLAEFKRISNEFEREFGENLSLEEFLQQIALQSGEDESASKDTVKLMTIHSSKGLEFPVVFILGLTEGVFPSAKTLGDRKNLGLEEERRLCYVAITRAEKYLFLMESEGVSQNGMRKLVSRFLAEIGENHYIRVGQISEDLLEESRNYTEKLNRELWAAIPEAKGVGDTVEHHIFGKGIIQTVDKKRGSYLVKFEKMKQPRNISISYFEKEHTDARLKNYEEPKVFSEEKTVGDHSVNDAQSAMKNNQEAFQMYLSEDAFEETEKDPEKVHEIPNDFTLHVTSMMQEKLLDSEICDNELCEAGTEGIEWRMEEQVEDPCDAVQDSEYMIEEMRQIESSGEKEDVIREPIPNDRSEPVDKIQNVDLKELRENSPNLWKRDDVPHSGWKCVGVEDLGAPEGICEMCGYQIIRYVHHMEHPNYRPLAVGCVCAGKMEGNIEGAKKREAEFKNRQSRRLNFFKRSWRQSKKGNEYLKMDGHLIVLYNIEKPRSGWKYSVDNQFCNTIYPTRERAMAALFDALEKLR